jgi:hypothetical protein
MGKRKKKKKQEAPVSRPNSPIGLVVGVVRGAFRRNPDILAMSLGVLHILFFLTLFITVTFLRTQSTPVVFGAASVTPVEVEAPQEEESGPPVSTVKYVAYIAFTLFVWAVVFLQRRLMGKQLFRFALIMLAPGTALSVYAVVVLVLRM